MIALLILCLGDSRNDGELRFEPAFNISVEFWPSSNDPVNGASFDELFLTAGALEGELGLAYYWTPGSASFELMIRPYVGYSYRQFEEHKTTMTGGGTLDPDPWTIQTAFGGLTIGGGHLPVGDEFGLFVYVTGTAGVAYQDHVMAKAPALYAGKQELFDSAREFCWSGGIGVEVRKEWVGVHLEVGARNFGRVRQGSGPIAIDEIPATVIYLTLGATFTF